MTAPVPTIIRFWRNVQVTDECWLWKASCDKDGYGSLRLSRTRKSVRAHRYSFELFYGSIPDGAIICHTCDTPSCVNPAHLYAGDHLSNARDKVERGRWMNGYVAAETCKYGHPFNEENTQLTSKGWRVCRACNRRRQEQSRRRKENP